MVAKNKAIGITIAIVIAIGVSAYLLTMQQPTANNPITVNMVYPKFIDSVPLFVAIENGYFKEANINVNSEVEQDASLVTSALLSGQADVGFPISTTDLLLIEEKEPGKIKLFLAAEETQNLTMILVKADSPITSLNELKGKKIGTLPGSIGNILPKMILKNYFDPSQATLVALPPTDLISALDAGSVDAIWTASPITNIAIRTGVAKSILNSADLTIQTPMPTVGYGFSTKFVNEHPETAKKIVEIIKKAADYLSANPEEGRQLLAKYLELPENDTGPLGWSSYSEASSAQQVYQNFADKMFEQGYLDKKVDMNDLIYKP